MSKENKVSKVTTGGSVRGCKGLLGSGEHDLQTAPCPLEAHQMLAEKSWPAPQCDHSGSTHSFLAAGSRARKGTWNHCGPPSCTDQGGPKSRERRGKEGVSRGPRGSDFSIAGNSRAHAASIVSSRDGQLGCMTQSSLEPMGGRVSVTHMSAGTQAPRCTSSPHTGRHPPATVVSSLRPWKASQPRCFLPLRMPTVSTELHRDSLDVQGPDSTKNPTQLRSLI